MRIQDFPRGCCGFISELMGDYFNTLGVGEFFYVCGVKEGASHAWPEADTGISHCRFGASSPRFSPSSSLKVNGEDWGRILGEQRLGNELHRAIIDRLKVVGRAATFGAPRVARLLAISPENTTAQGMIMC
jgi:hypothetical protein